MPEPNEPIEALVRTLCEQGNEQAARALLKDVSTRLSDAQIHDALSIIHATTGVSEIHLHR